MSTPFQTTVIGSMPKRPWLFKPNVAIDGRRDHLGEPGDWQLEGESLALAQDDATRAVLREQERAGVDVVSDGEQRRKNYIVHHASLMNGFDYQTLGEKTIRGGRRTVLAGRCIGPIEYVKPIALPDLAFMLQETDKAVKVALPGPMTMEDSSHDAYYHDERAFAFAWAEAINQEARALADAGAAVVQFDEPVFSRFPDRVADWGIEALDRCVEGVSCKTAVHICYGYPAPGLQRPIKDSYPDIVGLLNESKVDQLALEFAGSKLDPAVLAACPSKTVLFGCVSSSDEVMETPEHVAERLLAAAEALPPEQIQAAPDCGLVMMSPENAARKLQVMVEGAALARSRL